MSIKFNKEVFDSVLQSAVNSSNQITGLDGKMYQMPQTDMTTFTNYLEVLEGLKAQLSNYKQLVQKDLNILSNISSQIVDLDKELIKANEIGLMK